MKNEERDVGKYLLFGLILLFIFLSYLVAEPYLIVLVSTFILAYLFKPLQRKLSNYIGERFSALICLLLVFIIFILPLGLLLSGLTSQAYNFFNSGQLENVADTISEFPLLANLDISLVGIFQKFGGTILNLFSSFFSYLPSLIISLFVLFFSFYYILVDWEKIVAGLEKIIPLKDKKGFISELDSSTKSMIYGTFLIGLIEFLVAGLGFWFLGIKFALVLGLLVFFTAFIPGIGPSFVWIPTAIYYAFQQNWFVFGGVVVIGLIIGFYVDFILRTQILGNKTKIHPIVMLVGIFGGVSLFGIFGFVIGPLILSYTIKIIQKTIGEYYIN